MIPTKPILGIACGLLLATLLLPVSRSGSSSGLASPSPGPILSECDGALRELVIHYVPDAPFALTAYQSFLPQLPAGVTVYAVCPTQDAWQQLTRSLGHLDCELRPVITSHPITTWSRDRWIACAAGRRTALLCPREETAAAVWPDRDGDQHVAFTLSRAIGNHFYATRSLLSFDGGDFLADSRCVFVTPALLHRNLQQTVQSTDELLRHLGQAAQRRVVLLDVAPNHHAGMFMMAAGNGAMLVGDPSLAKPLWEQLPASAAAQLSPPGWQPDFSAGTQMLFDAVAHQVIDEGYRVLRIPVVPGKDSRAYLTWVNVLMDHRSERVVYMPTYRGAGPLNSAAENVWQALGYCVRRVDCTDAFPHYGTLHCLVNVLARSPS